jgi:predicted AAA+ superfamily ATPase
MTIKRFYDNLLPLLFKGKVLVLFGPRQVGKTTLIKNFLAGTRIKYRFETGDNLAVQNIFNSQDQDTILEYAAGQELIAIDEAQKIENIGAGLKLLVDHRPDIMVIATGSSSFALAGQVGEPLTGRKTTLTLFPVSQIELIQMGPVYDVERRLDEWLIYGGYPEVVAAEGKKEKVRLLMDLTQSYLLKDVLELEQVKGSKVLLDLLRLLAFQIGQEVSLSELGRQLGIDYKTVARYLDLFEKSFILYNLRGYSRNLRKEVTQKSKYFFYDNGVRNALISNFNGLELRNDAGQLWENFLFMERLKKQAYREIHANNFFWRTWDQKEVDFIEERDGKLFGYEFKWGGKTVKRPKEWLAAYPEAEFSVVNRENYREFVA